MKGILANCTEKMLGISGAVSNCHMTNTYKVAKTIGTLSKLSHFRFNGASLTQRATATFSLVTNIRMKLSLSALWDNIWISKTKFTLAMREHHFIEQM